MTRSTSRTAVLALVLATLLPARTTLAQAIPSSGRFSLFANWSQREPVEGESYDFSELIATLSFYSDRRADTNFEYGLDTRVATYPSSEARDERVSIYEAWIGLRASEGRFRLRVGQMWLRDLGGLGSVGGLWGEYRAANASSFGQFRFGLYGGLEPKIREAGYVDDIMKGGVYVAVDGSHGRRHVLGWTMIRNDDLTERSVITFNNFIPVARKFFLYQGLQYDTEGPAGLGDSQLSYFFTNIRYAPVRLIEFQGTYHRGRSIDARSITDDVLDGRPVSPERLDGLLFESGRFRVTLNPWRRVRFWAGYGRDRNNRDDEWSDRLNYGFSVNDILGVPARPRVRLDLRVARQDPGPSRLPDARLQHLALDLPLLRRRRRIRRTAAGERALGPVHERQHQPTVLPAAGRRVHGPRRLRGSARADGVDLQVLVCNSLRELQWKGVNRLSRHAMGLPNLPVAGRRSLDRPPFQGVRTWGLTQSSSENPSCPQAQPGAHA
jgi:hypothetical protein